MTIGTPSAKSVNACPAPQASPSPAASRARRSVDASRVVTAARWSGSVAWRRPSRMATPITSTSVVPSENEARKSSSPNISAHFRDGPHGHCRAGDDDNEGADRREQADHAALELEPAKRVLGEDRYEPDPRDREREPGAERDDQAEPEGDPVQRDGREEHDERGRAGEKPAGDADRGQRAPAELPVAVVVMVVPVTMGSPVPDAPKQYRRADADHEQPGDEPDPGVELLGDDELRERERDEAEREDADRVRRGHDQAERGGVSWLPALADEVGGHDRLPVAG